MNNEIGAELQNQINTKQFLLKMTPCCLAVLAMFAQQAYAETVSSNASVTANVDQKPTTQLEKIVITATRTPKNIADIAGTVQTIEKNQIEQQSGAGRKLADVLAQLVPSLAPSTGTTTNYGQTMRGRDVMILIDGVSQNGSRDVARQLNSISPSMIERIEVLSGATSIYGSGATGGIINIITKRADASQPLSFETKLGITSSDTFRGDGLAYEVGQSVAFSKDNLNGFLGANFTSRGSQFDSHGDRIAIGPMQTSRQDTDTIDVNGRISIDLTDTQSLSFGAQYYKDKQDSEYGPDYGPNYVYGGLPNSYIGKKGLQLPTQPFTERYAFNTQYQNQNVLGQVLNLEAYYRKEDARFYPVYTGAAMTEATQSQSNIDVAGFRSTMQSDLNIASRDLKLTYGVDYDHEKDDQYYDHLAVSNTGLHFKPTGKTSDAGPDTTIQNVGTFLQVDYALTDRLNVQAGTRYQYIKAKTEAYTARGVEQPSGSVSDDTVLFNLGTVYKLTDDQQAFANFSQGFSFPDVQRMMRDAFNLTTTADLQPIRVNSYELGWRLNDEQGLNLGITGFYNTSDKVTKFENRVASIVDTDQRIYGAEVTASYPFMQDFKVGGSLGYTRGQFKDKADNKWKELNATQVSPTKGTVFAEWNNDEGFGTRVQMLAVKGTDEALKDGSPAAVKIKGYTTMDVLTHFPAWKGRVDFGVYNVWNRDYRTVYSQQAEKIYGLVESLPAEGRTYGLSYTFNY
ncbi:TonB-dependent receptor [Acinetobacter halotolerans]|uniref:TonB-dependent receptor n=2 Tax=Acinetobacter halotolerans TaxID=1752076 RepID=A0A4V2DB70_9GAMM|nr:TonB-dependent receptor [Acinetobacter halotolerans]